MYSDFDFIVFSFNFSSVVVYIFILLLCFLFVFVLPSGVIKNDDYVLLPLSVFVSCRENVI